jgi:hypothetical protein
MQEKLLSVVDSPKMVISRESIRRLFSDVLEVIASFNAQLLDQLKLRLDNWSDSQTMGDVFLELVK